MEAVSLLLSKQSKSQQILCSLIITLPSLSLRCRGCHHLTLSFLTHPLEHFESHVPETSNFLLISKSFNLWHDFCLLLELLLLSTTCFSLAFFQMRISLYYQNIYFCDVLPAPVQEVLVFGFVPRDESKAKVIVLATAAELEVPISWRVWGDGWERPSTDIVKNKMKQLNSNILKQTHPK